MKPPLRLPGHDGNELARELRRGGCDVTYTGAIHLRAIHRASGAELILAGTPRNPATARHRARVWLRRLEAETMPAMRRAEGEAVAEPTDTTETEAA